MFNHPVMSVSLLPHGLQQASLSLTISRSFMFIALVMPSSHLVLWHPLLLLFSTFSSIRTFPMSHLFASDDQNTGASTSVSVFPVNIQGLSLLDHQKSKRVPEKHLLLLYWLRQSLWLCGSQETVENSSRDGTTWPASWEICMQVMKQQLKWTWNNRLVPNRKRSSSMLYIVTILI